MGLFDFLKGNKIIYLNQLPSEVRNYFNVNDPNCQIIQLILKVNFDENKEETLFYDKEGLNNATENKAAEKIVALVETISLRAVKDLTNHKIDKEDLRKLENAIKKDNNLFHFKTHSKFASNIREMFFDRAWILENTNKTIRFSYEILGWTAN